MATEQTVTIYRGEEIVLNFTMAPNANIAGWTLLFTVAKTANSPTKLITQAATITNPSTDGKFSVSLDADQSKDIKPGTYYFDVWRTDAEQERVLALGPFVIAAVARLPV